ncbi:MAG: ribosome small subunit-dependent GTPase A [Lachnospiraceae bacterium]
MQGKIIRGIAGFYYVAVPDGRIYECKAKGILRKLHTKPLVGDNVEIKVLDEPDQKGSLETIITRRNELIRPAVANIDQVLLVFSLSEPTPNLKLLDRFLITMEQIELPLYIIFNKSDLVDEAAASALSQIYTDCGYEVLLTSVNKLEGIECISSLLVNKTSVLTGGSGVGKSSLINLLQHEVHMQTGEISKKLGRGRHTTRHSELIKLQEDTYICDTPGFSSFYISDLEPEMLRFCFREFRPYEGLCRFQGCTHTHEPACAVKEAVAQHKINEMRYENYVEFFQGLKEKRRKY